MSVNQMHQTRRSGAGFHTGTIREQFLSCPACGGQYDAADLEEQYFICPDCSHHFRLSTAQRISMVTDEDSFQETSIHLRSVDPLRFPGYKEKLEKSRHKTGLHSAVTTGTASILGRKAALGVMAFDFVGGSMGSVVGEKLCRILELGIRKRLPVVLFTASGGARMQEGIFSLMQMARVSQVMDRARTAGIPVFVVLTNPTTGGVTASFAMLGTVTLAEPHALVGFAGRRVIEGTINQKLPDTFQTAEFQMQNGFVDAIVQRARLRETLAFLIDTHGRTGKIRKQDLSDRLRSAVIRSPRDFDFHKEVWSRVEMSRHAKRPTALEYIDCIFEEFLELHGDRCYSDDPAMIGGIARLGGQAVTVIGHQKGRNLKESVSRNYGMALADGYRKALRLAKEAERFGRPVITFVDTPGAYPGVESEQRGIGEAIARNLMEFSGLKVPVITIIIGEGGSGGALGIGVADEVYMLENSIYSVITPEGCASILLRDVNRAREAAMMMKITAGDLLSFGVIDGILREPESGAQGNPLLTAENMRYLLLDALRRLSRKPGRKLTSSRAKRIRSLGVVKADGRISGGLG